MSVQQKRCFVETPTKKQKEARKHPQFRYIIFNKRGETAEKPFKNNIYNYSSLVNGLRVYSHQVKIRAQNKILQFSSN